MGKKFLSVFLTMVLTLSVFAGCSKASNISSGAGDKDYPVAIGDVTIKSEPSGVAVLSPNIASVILSMGYEACLKARSAGCAQSDLSVLPAVTADDAKKIHDLGANVVFADSLTKKQTSEMEKEGIAVLILEPAASRKDLERLYSSVGSVIKGARTGYLKGQKIADGLYQTIDDITRVVPESDTPITAVYLENAEGSAATGDMLAAKLIQAAGLTNPASGATGGKYKASDLLLADPNYIFCAEGVKEKLESSEEYSKLTAVKDKKVYEMDPSLMTLQGEELIQSVSFMAGTVHPGMLKTTSSSSGPSSSEPSSSQTDTDVNLDQTLKSGMQSDDVLKMQNRLEELGYMFVKPTGLYAEGTEQAVKDFQLLNDMTVTGVADSATMKKMFSSSAVKRKDS